MAGAMIYEDDESRTGQIITEKGTFNAKRDFHVEVENVLDRAELVIQIPSAVSTQSQIKAILPGSPYPPQRIGNRLFDDGLIAKEFENLTGANPIVKHQMVRVHYGFPTVIEEAPTTFEGWTLEFDSGLETETVRFDLNGKPIGSHVYDPTDPPPQGEPPEAQNLFLIETGSRTVYLRRSENQFNFQPVSRTRDTTSFSLIRTFENLPPEIFGAIADAKNKLNELEFFGFAPRTVKFTNGRIRQTGGTRKNPTTGRQEVESEGSLHFAYNRLGWDHETFETWKDDKGQESIVFQRRPEGPFPVKTVSVLYDTHNFENLLSVFG